MEGVVRQRPWPSREANYNVGRLRFAGMLIATAQFPTLGGDSPRIELQIEPSTQLVGVDRFEHAQACRLVWASFQR
jgi:hypothetical protein